MSEQLAQLKQKGGGTIIFSKYVLFGGRLNASGGVFVYDNGSGQLVANPTSMGTTFTNSDLVDVQYIAPNYVFRFKEKCTVIAGHGTTNDSGVKNVGDSISMPRSNDTALFAYN